MKNDIAFIEPFAGIGGFRLGLEGINRSKNQKGQAVTKAKPEERSGLVSKAGEENGSPQRQSGGRLDERADQRAFNCIYSNEWDKYCIQIYEKNFKERPDERDIRAVPSKEIPDHDLLCAGWPCQSFSIAGKGAGFEDTRGTLFFEIARILRDKRPGHLLLENVKGLLSHQAGQTFQTILGVLAGLGYRCEWQVLNSKNFGVPQNRERVFIVGHLGEGGGFQVFPIEEADQIHNENNNRQIAKCLDSSYHKGWLDHEQRTMIHTAYPGGIREYKETSPTISTPSGGGHLPYIANAVDCDGYLRQMGVHHDKPICHYRIRKLTPIECERLQGFPDNWTKGVSDTQRYKMLGNAVTVNVVEAIGRRIREVLGA